MTALLLLLFAIGEGFRLAEPAAIATGPPKSCSVCDPGDTATICQARKLCYCGDTKTAPLIDFGQRIRCKDYASVGAWWCDAILDVNGQCAFRATSTPGTPIPLPSPKQPRFRTPQ